MILTRFVLTFLKHNGDKKHLQSIDADLPPWISEEDTVSLRVIGALLENV